MGKCAAAFEKAFKALTKGEVTVPVVLRTQGREVVVSQAAVHAQAARFVDCD